MTGLPAVARTVINLFLVTSLLLASVPFTQFINAISCSSEQDCSNQIAQQSGQLSSIQQQQASLQSQLDAAQKSLNSTQSQLNDFQNKANAVTAQLNQATADLNNAQGILDKNKAVFKIRVRDMYERGVLDRFQLFLGNHLSFNDSVELYALNSVVLQKNRDIIILYTSTVKNLAAARDQVAQAKQTADQQLAQIQSIRNAQSAQVYSIKQNQSALNNQISQINSAIANLTSQQQAIIAAKLAATQQNTSVGNAPPPTTPLGNSPFSPGFAFLTYGYPHRIGMNQYGALGRANAGQGYQDILQAYYGMQATNASAEPATIPVSGYGNISFEDQYLKGIGEMPSSWPINALRAQAVAARTYAWYWLNSHPGQSICTDQNCQVYLGYDKGGAWDQAVNDTRGQVLGGNSPIGAFYSSTDGGYTCTDFNHNNPCTPYLVDAAGGAWSVNTAFDGPSYGNSPWFHKAWGTNSDGKTAWLSAAEAADIFNAQILSQVSSSYNQYLSPPDQGGWSPQQVISQLTQLGQPHFDSLTSVSVVWDGHGNTSSISATGANGYAAIYDGNAFHGMFNLRSLGTLVLYTSFYDVTKSP